MPPPRAVVGEAGVGGQELAHAGRLEELPPLLAGVGQEADMAVLRREGPLAGEILDDHRACSTPYAVTALLAISL